MITKEWLYVAKWLRGNVLYKMEIDNDAECDLVVDNVSQLIAPIISEFGDILHQIRIHDYNHPNDWPLELHQSIDNMNEKIKEILPNGKRLARRVKKKHAVRAWGIVNKQTGKIRNIAWPDKGYIDTWPLDRYESIVRVEIRELCTR